MVFVSIGTQKQDFSRIFNLVEKSSQLKNEEIIAQTGNTKFKSNKMKCMSSIDSKNYSEYIKKADMVICHGGVGTIFEAIENEKRVLVVPRLKKYKEHINDHQLEAACELEKDGYLIVYKDGEDFDKYILKLQKFTPRKYKLEKDFIDILKKEI